MTYTPLASGSYSALDVADHIIWNADSKSLGINEDGKEIFEGVTNLKLQKLLYFAEAAHLALFGKSLFEEEIQAWGYGPVVPCVYRHYKQEDKTLHRTKLSGFEFKEHLQSFLGDVWNVFGKYSSGELVQMSHDHAPWKDVYKKGERNIVISRDSMKFFYKKHFKVNERA